ncbi:MAG: hypothetical protein LBN25_00860 [Christensenellaceae bacterium]|jgi:phosphoglucosamine mutase|nr:hypothetical protein [Christensenellaceae bacterium]
MKYFGTDGIRKENGFFSEDFLRRVSRAVMYFAVKQSGINPYNICAQKGGRSDTGDASTHEAACFSELRRVKTLIARDTRVSGNIIAKNLSDFLQTEGAAVINAGVIPTPAASYLGKKYDADLTIVISASHNGEEYNGLKFFYGSGEKFSVSDEATIEKLIDDTPPPLNFAQTDAEDLLFGGTEYCEDILKELQADLTNITVLLDLANGASLYTAPYLLRRAGAEVVVINEKGAINKDCGAVHPEMLRAECKERKINLGFAFDGDGDRCVCCLNGKILDGGALLYAIAKDFQSRGALTGNAVCGSILTNTGVENALSAMGIKLHRANVGDKNITQVLKAEGLKIGGEPSGHLIFADFLPTGDGSLTAFIAAAIYRRNGLKDAERVKLNSTTEKEIIVNKAQLLRFNNINYAKQKIEEVQQGFSGRIIVRPSGTEPVIRVFLEALTETECKVAAAKTVAVILKAIEGKPQKEILEGLKANGVAILDEDKTIIEDTVTVGKGTVIHEFTKLSGKTEIGANCQIYPFCDITDTVIGEGTTIHSLFSSGAKVGSGCTIGPFTCLRAGSIIGDGCRIGDFVEVKNSKLNDNVKAAHLAYIGDAVVGGGTNVGCGTVFANYNGKEKQQVIVGQNVFIGANTNLVAPLTVEDNAFIAAGSTVTKDVPENALCIARALQTHKEGRGNLTRK